MPFSQSGQPSTIVRYAEALQPRSMLDIGTGTGTGTGTGMGP